MITHATVNSLLRCTQAYCNQLCEKHTLDFGIVYCSERFPRVGELNQFREVIAETEADVVAAIAEVDAWSDEHGLTCHRWAPAMGRASAALAEQLIDRGFERRVDRALRLTTWPEPDPGSAVRVLPARAMRAAYQTTLEVAPPFGEIASPADMAAVARERLDDPSLDMFVAMVDKQPAGRCALYQVGDLAQVRSLSVLPGFSDANVERALLLHALALAKRLTIANVLALVPEDDTSTLAALQRVGFVTDGEIESYCRRMATEKNPPA